MKSALRRITTVAVSLSLAAQPFAAAASYVYQVPMDAPDMSAAVPGALQATPSSYSFGTLVLGSTVATSTTIKNTGQDSVTITGIDVPAPFSQTNNCPATLVGGASCVATVVFNPSSAGTFSGVLNVATSGGAGAAFGVSGTAVVPTTNLTVSPNLVNFGASDVGVSATSQSVTVTNAGNSPATVNGVGITSGATDFAQSNNCGSELSPGASCTISLSFTPSAYGARSGNLNIYEQASGTLYSVALSGSGNAAILAVAPTSLDLGSAIANYASKTGTVTLSNQGNLAITGLTADVSASDFSQTGTTCTGSLAAGSSCTVTVKFAPTASGARTGTVLIGSANGGTKSVALTGTGDAQAPSVQATATSLAFPDTVVGTSSAAKTVTFTNNGNVDVGIASVGLTAGGTNFQGSSNCGTTLAVGASCTATATFSPQQSGVLSGALSAAFSHTTVNIALSGTGTQGYASVNPSSLAFVTTQVASTAAVQTVTVTNTGNRALTFSGVGIASGMADFAQSNDCASVVPGSTCSVNVTFTPSTTGARTGTLAFVHDGSGLTTVSLSGTGQAASATLSTPTFSATPVGSSSTGVATLNNTGIGSLSVTVPSAASVTGTDFSFSSTTCGSSLVAGASCTVSVRFSPTSTAPRSGQLSVNTAAGNQTVTLGSTGIQGYANVSPSSLTFATQQTGTTSGVQTVTVTNTGTDTLTFTGVGISNGATDFAQSNNCGSVAVNGTCTVNVNFTPTASGARSGTLSFTHNGGGIANVSLSGTGQSASATLSTPTWASSVQVSATSDVIATVTNTGIGPVTVTTPTSGSVSGTDFSFVSSTCSSASPLAAGATCNVTVRFAPMSAGAKTGTLSVSTTGGGLSAPLNATGIQGNVSLSSTSLSFAAQQTGTASAAQTVTLTNNGTSTLTVSSVSVSAGATDFAQTNNCTSVAVNGTCTISVTFTPSTTGARLGTLSLSHNGTGPTAVSLSGTGQGQSASLSTPSFPATSVGSSNNATATLSNTGIGALSVTVPTGSSVTGTDFSFVSTTCGTSVAVGGTCSITVKFSPTSTAARTGTLTVATGAGNQSVSLGSTGIQGYASVSPSSLSFSAQQTGTTSGVQTVTVTNTGTDTLTFTGVGISVGGTDFAQTNNCSSVAVNGTCTVNVNFTPSAAGARSGTLSFTHNGGGIANVSLSGTGQAPSATLSNVAFGNLVVGSSSTLTSTLANTGLASISVTVPTAASVSGTDFSFVSTTCTSTLASGANCTVSVKFQPTASAARSGTLSFATGAGTVSATLSGTGQQGNASLSPASLSFSGQTVGTSSATQSVTITNNGTSSLTISGVTVSAGSSDFSQTNTCGSAMAVNGTCTITVTFTPSTSGARSGTVSFSNNGAGATSFSVSGTGVSGSSASASFSPTTVTSGSSSTLSWTTSGASSVSVSCSAPASYSYSGASVNSSGTVSTSGTGTGSCTVTPYNSLGVAGTPSTANLSVVAAPSVTSKSFSPTTVTTGGSSTFSWNTNGATSASVSCTGATGSGSGTSGSITVTTSTAGTGTCTVTATNAAGTQATGSANLSIVSAPSVTGASFSPTTVTVGGSSTFSWNTSGATSASVSCSGAGATATGSGTSGSIAVGTSATGTATCTVTATNAAGTNATGSGNLSVVAAPVVSTASFSASTVTSGGTNTLTWNTGYATSTSVSCSGAATGSTTGNSGSLTVGTTGTGTGTCTITATNAAGTQATSSPTFSVVAAPSTTGATFSPSTVTTGGTSQLCWNSANTTSTVVSCTSQYVYSWNGSQNGLVCSPSNTSTSGTGVGTCTLTSYNAAGSSTTTSANISVVAAPSVTGASFSPTSVTAGSSSTFSWTTSNATSASVSCSGASGSGSGTSGSITVTTSAAGTATCTVTASNAAGTQATRSANLTINSAVVAPSASVNPTSYAAGSTPFGTTKSATITFTNSGGAGTFNLSIGNYVGSGIGTLGFTQGTCPANGSTLGANSSCSFTVYFIGDDQCGGSVRSQQATVTAAMTNVSGSSSAGVVVSGAAWVYTMTAPQCR